MRRDMAALITRRGETDSQTQRRKRAKLIWSISWILRDRQRDPAAPVTPAIPPLKSASLFAGSRKAG